MMSALITAIVFAAVMSAYTFLGRSLIRLGNADSLESGVRRTLYYFGQDAAAATAVTTANASQLVLSLPSGTVKYTYDSVGQTLTRYSPSSSSTGLALLSGVTSFTFDYYQSDQTTATVAAQVKLVDLVATSVRGVAAGGAQSHFTFASPRMMLRNKPYLQ